MKSLDHIVYSLALGAAAIALAGGRRRPKKR